MLKNKKATLIVGAIVFLLAIFFLKNQSEYKSQASQDQGLAVGNLMVQDLLNKDTDSDGVPDWVENLMGTDPGKKETTPGIPDAVAVQRIEAENKANVGSAGDTPTSTDQNQTQTDKFSQELFSTVAALSQTGQVDQTTVDKLSTSLVDNLKNSAPRKVFLMSEMKVGTDDSAQAYQNYGTALNAVYTKNPTEGTEGALDVLKEFINDGNNVNVDALAKLDPIIKQSTAFMNGMVTISVPPGLSQAHLDVVNGLERLIENLNDIQMYDSDVIVAMGAVTKFEENNNLFQTNIQKLEDVITQKLNS